MTAGKGRRPAPERSTAGDDGALAARRVALDLLDAVLDRNAALDAALTDSTQLARLVERDRAFTRTLVATTLRRLGQIDAILDSVLAQPRSRLAPKAANVLRLGVCQMVFLGTPAHAAVHCAVALAQGAERACAPALVNAVLRRVAREGAALAAGHDAARLNTPAWLWSALAAAYGEDVCRAIARAHLDPPPLDLTASDPAAVAALVVGRLLPSGTVRLDQTAPVASLPGYAEGRWWVQDAAAALPARLLGDVCGRSVVDLCAAPGGKTAQLAAAGARVIAVDRAPARLARLRDNLARLGLAAETVLADGVTWRPVAPVDAVLVDAPCSSTGTIRRHPDIAWRRTATDVEALLPGQDRLLDAALAMVRPGGMVVYAVCSLLPAEGPARVAALLARSPGVRRLPIGASEIGGAAELVTACGDLLTLPSHWAELGGLDGFYACRLVKD